jgi:hypothetical protein
VEYQFFGHTVIIRANIECMFTLEIADFGVGACPHQLSYTFSVIELNGYEEGCSTKNVPKVRPNLFT